MIKVEHKGFRMTGMVGDLSAEISDDGEYVEVVLTDGNGHTLSFDLNGFQTFIEDLCQVRNYAEQVDRCNKEDREEVPK